MNHEDEDEDEDADQKILLNIITYRVILLLLCYKPTIVIHFNGFEDDVTVIAMDFQLYSTFFKCCKS